MVKFTVSTKHETLLSLHGCKKEKESLDQNTTQLESNFEKYATNLVKMNYRLAFVFSYERFKNALNLRNFGNFYNCLAMNTAGNRTCIITSRLSDLSHRGVYTHIKAGKHVMFEKQQFPASFFTKGHGLYKKIFHHSLQHTCTYLRKILV